MSRTFCASCGNDLQPDAAICACDAERLEQRISARYVVTIDASAFTRCVDEIRTEVERLKAVLEPDALKGVVALIDATFGRVGASHLGARSAASRIALDVPPDLLALRAALRAYDGRGDLALFGAAESVLS